MNIPKRVQRGVRILDKYDPEWVYKVDLPRLNQASGIDCVVAQVAGNNAYIVGMTLLGITYGPYNSIDYNRGARLGFTLGCNDQDDDSAWERLTNEWKRVIMDLRSPVTLNRQVRKVSVSRVLQDLAEGTLKLDDEVYI